MRILVCKKRLLIRENKFPVSDKESPRTYILSIFARGSFGERSLAGGEGLSIWVQFISNVKVRKAGT